MALAISARNKTDTKPARPRSNREPQGRPFTEARPRNQYALRVQDDLSDFGESRIGIVIGSNFAEQENRTVFTTAITRLVSALKERINEANELYEEVLGSGLRLILEIEPLSQTKPQVVMSVQGVGMAVNENSVYLVFGFGIPELSNKHYTVTFQRMMETCLEYNLSWEEASVFTVQPIDADVQVGGDATFTVEHNGELVHWEATVVGTVYGFRKYGTGTGNTLVVSNNPNTNNGRYFRAVIKNADGSQITRSNAAILNIVA